MTGDYFLYQVLIWIRILITVSVLRMSWHGLTKSYVGYRRPFIVLLAAFGLMLAYDAYMLTQQLAPLRPLDWVNAAQDTVRRLISVEITSWLVSTMTEFGKRRSVDPLRQEAST